MFTFYFWFKVQFTTSSWVDDEDTAFCTYCNLFTMYPSFLIWRNLPDMGFDPGFAPFGLLMIHT
jgi:hypothetical protein